MAKDRQSLTLDHLNQAARAGGPSALSSVTHLEPAAGPHGSIAPARYAGPNAATYIYEDRWIDGERLKTVLIDSKSSMANRMEEAINDAIRDNANLISRIPRVKVTYTEGDKIRTFTDLDLPHRLFDAHIRAGTIDGTPTTQHADYIKARNSEPGNAWDALNTSFATVAFGGWDSSRRARQARYPSILTGEINGVLADQESTRPRPAQHSGARIDPVAMGLKLSPASIDAIVEQQKHEYSSNFLSKKNRKPSELGFGAIPPGTEDLAGIATRDIIRSHVLSFALLRRLRFGQGQEGDASLRVLVAALLLNAMARSDSELYLRANCHLVEAAPPEVRLDQRMGHSLDLAPITIELADALLEQAYAEAVDQTGIEWNGLVLRIQGNPDIVAAADADAAN